MAILSLFSPLLDFVLWWSGLAVYVVFLRDLYRWRRGESSYTEQFYLFLSNQDSIAEIVFIEILAMVVFMVVLVYASVALLLCTSWIPGFVVQLF